MASIKNRGPNAWQVRIRRTGYPTITETFATKDEARKWAEKTEEAMKDGAFVNTSASRKILLCDLLDEYLEKYCSNKKSYASDRSYANELKRNLGQYAVVNLSIDDVDAYLKGRLIYGFPDDADEEEKQEIIATNKREKRVGPNTVIHYLKFLAKAIDYGKQRKSIVLPKENPARKVQYPKRPHERTRRLSEEEKQLLFQHATSPWLPDLIDFAIETCMRRGELARMRWSHVNLKLRTLHIAITKNGEPRTIPLTQKAADILKGLLGDKDDDGSVWGVSADKITQVFGDTRDAAGIKDLHFHDLRHEGISRLFERGMETMEVASISGHRDPRELKRYTHIKPTHLVKRLDETEIESEPTDTPECPPPSSEVGHATSSKSQNSSCQMETKVAQSTVPCAISRPESGPATDLNVINLADFRRQRQSAG